MLTAKDGTWDEAEGLDTARTTTSSSRSSTRYYSARLRALIRRGPTRLPPVLAHGPLSMDPGPTLLMSGDVLRSFSRLLRYLMTHRR